MNTPEEQILYYQARAGEYDEWFYRLGRYDRGPEMNERWFEEAARCMRELQTFEPVERALELAAGTGIWTRELLKLADCITAIDASSEMLAINRAKLGSAATVSYEQANLFDWEPTAQFDLVSFTFWLSHVPPDLVETFLSKVYRATKPGGRVWMVDSKRTPTGGAMDQLVRNGDPYQDRKLNDGRTFRIVKVYYDCETLNDLFKQAGFTANVRETPTYFIYAKAERRSHSDT